MSLFGRLNVSIFFISLSISFISCNKEDSCAYLGDADDLDLSLYSYECDGNGNRNGVARVDYLLESDYDFIYEWNIEGSSSVEDFINIEGSGPMSGFVRVTNKSDGCFIYKEVDMLFDMPHGTIGNQVWIDNQGGQNGIYDPSDEPAVDIRVELLDENKELLDAQITDASGKYLFQKLPEGNYILKFYKPEALSFCPPNLNNDTKEDSDVNAEGYTDIITISECESNLSIDAGLVR